MVEAIFNFKDINRRMNRKPEVKESDYVEVYDPFTDSMIKIIKHKPA
jgi:hypothetical protein